jgi:hypothetical protein
MDDDIPSAKSKNPSDFGNGNVGASGIGSGAAGINNPTTQNNATGATNKNNPPTVSGNNQNANTGHNLYYIRGEVV